MGKLNLGLLDDDFSNNNQKETIIELDRVFDGNEKRQNLNFENKIFGNMVQDSFDNFQHSYASSSSPMREQLKDINVNQQQPRKNPNKKLFQNLGDFQFKDELRIKIFGVGGAGNNMINHMARNSNIDNECLYAINTDYQVLRTMPNDINVVMIGSEITKGHGSGSDPEIGKKAALESESIIRDILQDTDLLFIVSGMGKGTGTGASPIIANIAKEMGIMTLSLVNLPSISNEGPIIFKRGEDGLKNLKNETSGILTISNEKLFKETSINISLMEAFSYANSVISNVIYDLINLINVPSKINVDFNDVKTFFKDPTEFQVNTFKFDSLENIEKIIMDQLRDQIYQDNINGARKAIVNLKLNPTINRDFINNVIQALIKITRNDDLEVTLAIDYFENIDCAIVTTLIAKEKMNNSSHNNQNIDTKFKYTRNISSNNNVEEKSDNELNENLEKLEIINTSNLESESKPKTIELNKNTNEWNDTTSLPNPFINSFDESNNSFFPQEEVKVWKNVIDDFASLKKEITENTNQMPEVNSHNNDHQNHSFANSFTSSTTATRRSFIPTRKLTSNIGKKPNTIRFCPTSPNKED